MAGGLRDSTSARVFDPRENMRRRRDYMKKNKWVEKYIFPVEEEPQIDDAEREETKLAAAKRLTSFCKGSMRRTGMFLTCHITGLTFQYHELQQFEVRQNIMAKALERANIPRKVYKFYYPEVPLPDQLFDVRQITDEWHDAAKKWNDAAIQSWKQTMTEILSYATENPDGHPNLGVTDDGREKGRDAVNHRINACMSAIKEETRREAKKPAPLPSDWNFPPAAERKRMFSEADANGNGRLSMFEIDSLVKRKWPQFNHRQAIIRAYKLADSSNAGRQDGFIERHDDEKMCEFTRFLKYLHLYTKYWHEFFRLDANGDGKVDPDEWLLKGKEVFGEALSNLSDQDMLEVFAEIDIDNNLRISYDEFCAWAAKLVGDNEICSDSAAKRAQVHGCRPSRMMSFARARKATIWKQSAEEPQNGPWSAELATAGSVLSRGGSTRSGYNRVGSGAAQRETSVRIADPNELT